MCDYGRVHLYVSALIGVFLLKWYGNNIGIKSQKYFFSLFELSSERWYDVCVRERERERVESGEWRGANGYDITSVPPRF